MRIVEITQLENGAHRSQTYHGALPDGWAYIPENVSIPNTFPFVYIDSMEDRDGAPYVTSMTANQEAWDTAMAEQEHPEEDPTDDNSSVWDELDAAYQEGVDSV